MMDVCNVHERVLAADPGRVGALIDALASPNDRLWPRHSWSAMTFDRPLGVGAVGGHGPIRYTVEAYRPGRRARFRFTAPRGFHGTHGFDVELLDGTRTRLRHVLMMNVTGRAVMTWPLVFRPLHDALIEDALDQAERSLGLTPELRRWSPLVKALRWMVSGGTAPPQAIA